MNVRSDSNGSSNDLLKWAAIFLLFVAGLVINFYFSAMAPALKLILWIVLLAGMGAIATLTEKGRMVLDFARESRTELRKVVWPSRQDTVRTTMMVIGLVLLMSLIMWGVDTFLLRAVGWLTGQRG